MKLLEAVTQRGHASQDVAGEEAEEGAGARTRGPHRGLPRGARGGGGGRRRNLLHQSRLLAHAQAHPEGLRPQDFVMRFGLAPETINAALAALERDQQLAQVGDLFFPREVCP